MSKRFTKGLTIGFEEETYTITEPTGVQTIQTVCMVILQGTLGRDLTVRPVTNDGTARSKNYSIDYLTLTPLSLYLCLLLHPSYALMYQIN